VKEIIKDFKFLGIDKAILGCQNLQKIQFSLKSMTIKNLPQIKASQKKIRFNRIVEGFHRIIRRNSKLCEIGIKRASPIYAKDATDISKSTYFKL